MTIKKILVVDDSPTERAFMESLLKRKGFDVTVVDSGEVAVERAKQDQPDLILMDVVMPGITTSMKIRSGVISRAMRTPSAPSPAVAVW